MRIMVPGFEHRPGVHCGSTAMADALRSAGIDLSEAMAFGLGAGLWFVMLDGPHLSPSTMFFGRSMTYESDLCGALGIDFDDGTAPTFDEAWPELRRLVQEGRPPLLVTDIKHLPHYGMSTPFNGHRVVLAGYDEEAGTAFVADTHFPGLCEVPLVHLKASMESDAPPVTMKDCSFASLGRSRSPPDLAALARDAVRLTASRQVEESEFTGVAGLERLAKTIPGWEARPDRTWCAKFGYQVIEKRGTGGALFRRLYAQFLREAGEVYGARELLTLVPGLENVADGWSEFAARLKALGDGGSTDFLDASVTASRLAEREREIWTAAAQAGGS
jgi:hypothetical protein